MPAKPYTLLAVALLLAGAAVSQSRPASPAAVLPRWSDRELAAVIARSPHAIGDRVDVKLREGCGAELVDGRLRSRAGVDLTPVEELLQGAQVEPLFPALSWDELDLWHRRACAVLPEGRGPGHLGLWFRVTTPTVEQAAVLRERLWDCDLVEHAVNEVRATPSSLPLAPAFSLPQDIPPPTPLFTSLQQCHMPSPFGHGTWRAQGVLGARGQNIALRVVEAEWFLDHEDVSRLNPANVIGPVPAPASEAHHGTMIVSVVAADRNEYGVTGMADEVDVKVISYYNNGGIPNSLLLAGTNSQPGDVVMLSMMFLLAQIGAGDWVPFELLQPVFDAILTLTGNGRIVLETIGNGDNSLDDPRFGHRFDRGYRDSGAIFAGASDGSLLRKAGFSNYGSRVDANGWGDDVCCCGVGTLFYPNNDPRQAYTADFTGTSSAVATLAGVVVSLQGAAWQQLERRLTNAEILQLLHTHGPLSPDPIGRRPDLYGILEAIGAVDGLAVSSPDVPLGGAETVTITGPAGSGGFLFASFNKGSLDLGLNRKIHLALSSILTIGFVPMPAGTAGFQIAIPNDPGLHGLSLYLQAGVLHGSSPVHVTNSGQLTIL